MKRLCFVSKGLALAALLAALPGCGSSGSGQSGQPPSTVVPAQSSSPSPTGTAKPAATTPAPATAQLPDSPPPKAAATDAQIAAAAKGDADFGLAVYAKIKGSESTFFSPASARLALAMAYAGAKGDTAAQMAKVLAVADGPQAHEAFGAIAGLWYSWNTAAAPASPDGPGEPFRFRVANRLFGQKGRAFVPTYLALLQDKYGAPLEQVDFKAAPEPSRAHINKWVEDHTEKRIKELLPGGSIKDDTKIVLVNALYFKGAWAAPFDKFATQDGDFFVTPQNKIKAPMMNKVESYGYAETDDAQILQMQYAGAPVAMTVLLPKAKDGLEKLEAAMTPAALGGWLAKISAERVKVSLPRFKIESSFLLTDTLRALGMTDALDSTKADFSGMDGTKELFIGAVIQKTFCAVDESGTEAAAATAVVARAGGMPPPPSKEVIADHPFLFMIRDTKTGSLLFMGRVVKPG